LKSFSPLKEQSELECSGAPVALVGGFAALPGGPVTSPASALDAIRPANASTQIKAKSALLMLSSPSRLDIAQEVNQRRRAMQPRKALAIPSDSD
jgi:hypothetical protein